MKLKINNEYFTDAEGTPFEFSAAIKNDQEGTVKLFDDANVCMITIGGIPDFSEYVLEGGDWTPAPVPEREQILAEADANAYELFLALQE